MLSKCTKAGAKIFGHFLAAPCTFGARFKTGVDAQKFFIRSLCSVFCG